MLAATSVAGMILALALFEGLLALLLAYPATVAGSELLLDRLRSVCVREDWSVVQTDPELVVYDLQLTYLLRPARDREWGVMTVIYQPRRRQPCCSPATT